MSTNHLSKWHSRVTCASTAAMASLVSVTPVLATYGIRATNRTLRRTDTISSQDRGYPPNFVVTCLVKDIGAWLSRQSRSELTTCNDQQQIVFPTLH